MDSEIVFHLYQNINVLYTFVTKNNKMKKYILFLLLLGGAPFFTVKAQVDSLRIYFDLEDSWSAEEKLYFGCEGLLPFKPEYNQNTVVFLVSQKPVVFEICEIKNSRIRVLRKIWVEGDTLSIKGPLKHPSAWMISPCLAYQPVEDKLDSLSQKEEKMAIIRQNIASYPAIYHLYKNRESMKMEELAELYEQIPAGFQEYFYAQCLKSRLLSQSVKEPKKGDVAPDFSLEDKTGQFYRLSEYRGKYVLLDFSSGGCGYCLEAIPELSQALDRYRDKLEIISLWNDPSRSVWQEWGQKQKAGITWLDLWDKTSYAFSVYRIKMYPTYILIDPEGKIEKIWKGYKSGSILKQLKFLRPAKN